MCSLYYHTLLYTELGDQGLLYILYVTDLQISVIAIKKEIRYPIYPIDESSEQTMDGRFIHTNLMILRIFQYEEYISSRDAVCLS